MFNIEPTLGDINDRRLFDYYDNIT